MDAIVQYTNAVFVALLPIVGDFCQKLDLPVPQPLRTNHVARFGVGFKNLGEVQGGIWLTNGFTFSFDWGYVYNLQTPTSFSNCQTAEDRPKYTGEVRVAWADAIQIVSNKLQDLQIPGMAELLRSKLQTNGPVQTKEYTLPYYIIYWSDWPNSVEVEYNADYRRIDSLMMAGPMFKRPPPRVPEQIVKRLQEQLENPKEVEQLNRPSPKEGRR